MAMATSLPLSPAQLRDSKANNNASKSTTTKSAATTSSTTTTATTATTATWPLSGIDIDCTGTTTDTPPTSSVPANKMLPTPSFAAMSPPRVPWPPSPPATPESDKTRRAFSSPSAATASATAPMVNTNELLALRRRLAEASQHLQQLTQQQQALVAANLDVPLPPVSPTRDKADVESRLRFSCTRPCANIKAMTFTASGHLCLLCEENSSLLRLPNKHDMCGPMTTLYSNSKLDIVDMCSHGNTLCCATNKGLLLVATSPARTDSASRSENNNPATAQLIDLGSLESITCSTAGLVAASQRQESGKYVIHLWSLISQKSYGTLAHHEDTIACLRFASNSQCLVSASFDHTVKLWRLPPLLSTLPLSSSLSPNTFTLTAAVEGLTVTPDGTQVYICGPFGIFMLDMELERLEPLHRPLAATTTGWCHGLLAGPQAKYLCMVLHQSSAINILDLANGYQEYEAWLRPDDDVSCWRALAISPDGSRLCAASHTHVYMGFMPDSC